MIRSMTGYAEKTGVYKTFSAKITVRSLNHRYLDWHYRGSPLGRVEDSLRNICQDFLSRGRVEVSVDLSYVSPERWEFRINQGLLKKIMTSLEKTPLGSNTDAVLSLESLMNIPHVIEFRRKSFSNQEENFLMENFKKVLQGLVKEKIREGREIKAQLLVHLRNIRMFLQELERQAKKQPELVKAKLKKRLQELNQESSVSENKLVEEASFLAQRYDLTEEVSRLKSHLKYFRELVNYKQEEPTGKKMDFVAQELFREANTINSKAQDISVIRKSLAIKAEVESIRQQVQNIE